MKRDAAGRLYMYKFHPFLIFVSTIHTYTCAVKKDTVQIITDSSFHSKCSHCPCQRCHRRPSLYFVDTFLAIDGSLYNIYQYYSTTESQLHAILYRGAPCRILFIVSHTHTHMQLQDHINENQSICRRNNNSLKRSDEQYALYLYQT